MKVYVLEAGEYSQKFTVGVYATPELAMAGSSGTWTGPRADECPREWYNADGDTSRVIEFDLTAADADPS